MSRLVIVGLQISLCIISFAASLTITSYACSVTNRQIIEQHLDDCVQSGSILIIYKTETNRITFSDGDFDNVQTYGLGQCKSPSVSGSQVKCYPDFNTPNATAACNPSACNCVRWSQFIQGKQANCGFLSCNCENSVSHEQFYLEETCFDETCGCPPGKEMPVCESPNRPYLDGCCCVAYEGGPCVDSPILIDVWGDGFALTDLANGINFDLDVDTRKERVAWTTVASDDAWLVLDRNGNELIDDGREVFGNHTTQPHLPGVEKNGFLALAEFDKTVNGGNADGVITRADVVFQSLRLWQDVNHNGTSEASELKTLSMVGIACMELDYKASRRTDDYGNRFRYRAKVKDANGAQVGRWAWDVFLVTSP
jgi:hypothetical protein